MRRLLSCVAAALCLLLANCTGTSLRSPVKDTGSVAVKPPALQSPVETKPVPCEKKPVYAPVAPHIDTGPAVCQPGENCDARDPLTFTGSPRYELPKPVQEANDANANAPCTADPCAAHRRPCFPGWPGMLSCMLALLLIAFLVIR